jgi:site-specific DNA-methyltransferase (adenine-specific)
MTPYYEEAGITIYCADCRDVLPSLPKVDLVLTDPPYGLDFAYASYCDTRQNLIDLITSAIVPAIAISERACILPGITQVYLYPEPAWIGCINWNTTGSFGKFGYTQWMPVLLYGSDVKGFGSVDGLLKSDVIHFNGGNGVGLWRIGDDQHPCPKPLNLIRSLVKRFALAQQTILDPFMGSGTTLVAAKRLGRRAIGIEIEQRYCDIAIERLRQDVLPLAPVAEPEARQDALAFL